MKIRHVIGVWFVIAAIALSANSAHADYKQQILKFLGIADDAVEASAKSSARKADDLAIRQQLKNKAHHNYEDAIKRGEVFPSLYDDVTKDPFAEKPELAGIFTNMRGQNLVNAHGNFDEMLRMDASTISDVHAGFALKGSKGSGKSTLIGGLESIFRQRAKNDPGAKEAFILKVNPLDTRFKNPESFDDVVRAMRDMPEVQNSDLLVFHFDDLKPFMGGEGTQASADFDSVVNALMRLETPDRKIKIAVEATEETTTGVLQKSRFGQKLREIKVENIEKTESIIQIVKLNLPLLDKAGEFTISDAKIARLVRWTKRYAPDKPTAATVRDLIGTVIAEQKRFFDPRYADHQLIDKVSEALRADKVDLIARLEEAKKLPGYEARRLTRELPDRIQDVQRQIDEASAEYANLMKVRSELLKKKKRLDELTDADGNFDPSKVNVKNRAEAEKIAAEYKELVADVNQLMVDRYVLSERRLAAELSVMTNTRVAQILKFTGKMDLKTFRAMLDETIFGQPKYKKLIMECAERIMNIQLGIEKLNPKKPMCAILAWGPPGTGKTDGLSLLRELLDDLYIVPGGEFTSSHSVATLTGAPPGYVGFEQGGALTQALIDNPRMAVILDELEKGDPVLTALANGMLDPAKLNDKRGIDVDVSQTFIGVTTNAGYKHIPEELRDNITLDELIKYFEIDKPGLFRPEFLNRFDERIVYVGRTKGEESHMIIQKFMRKVNEDPVVQRYMLRVHISEDALWAISNKVDADPQASARNLRTAIDKEMNTELKRMITAIGKQVDDAAGLDKVERLARQGHYIDRVTRKTVKLPVEKGDGLILDVDEAGNFFYRIRPRVQ